jgi:hypothetical protein
MAKTSKSGGKTRRRVNVKRGIDERGSRSIQAADALPSIRREDRNHL